MIKKLFQVAGLVVAVLGMSSCLTMEQNMSLNPDGSGKVAFNTSINLAALSGLGGGGAGGPDANEMGKQMLSQMVQSAKGVEQWADLKYGPGKEGAVLVSGTAYFSDVNKFSLDANEGPGGTQIKSKIKDGVWTIETVSAEGAGAKPPKLSDDEVKKKVAQMQQGWKEAKPIMEAMISTVKAVVRVKIAGSITKSVNFKKESANSASMTMDGKKLMTAMDKMINDDKLASTLAKQGIDPMGGQSAPETPEFYGLMFGENAFPKIVAKPASKPLFDYKAEVAKAKKNPTKAMKEILQD